jgi:hypothetical protein
MGFQDIDQANIRNNEALKRGLESQRAYREMHANDSVNRKSYLTPLRTKLLLIKGIFQQYTDIFYCRALSIIHSRPC